MSAVRRKWPLLVLALVVAPAAIGPTKALKQLGSWTNQAVSAINNAVLQPNAFEVNVANLSGVEPDRAGGLSALVLGVAGNAAFVALLVRYVEEARKANPLLHEGNVAQRQRQMPCGSKELLGKPWGWLRAAMSVTPEEIEAAAGLDAAMMAARRQSVLQTERSALLEERRRLGLCAHGEPDFASGVYGCSGFVTFLQRRDAEIALRLQYRADGLQFLVSAPPAPEDVRHEDLQKRTMGFGDYLLGYLCILFLFWAFAPFIVAFSAVARLDNLQTLVPRLQCIVALWPVIRTVWDGLASVFALGFFMSVLPNCLMFISNRLFVTKSGRCCQLQLQTWYFYFLVVFVLMVTAVGSSLFKTLSRLLDHPREIFSLLASTLPHATQFYLSYFPMQWSVLVLEATRYQMIAVKFLALQALWGAERAKELCEPEDQANYGIGARSARMALLLVTALVFCSLSPLICLLGVVTFLRSAAPRMAICWSTRRFRSRTQGESSGALSWTMSRRASSSTCCS
ncbi:unnamed protein product [Effrenium voratum]|nr:unnamed protein product [Effrenium voratum]